MAPTESNIVSFPPNGESMDEMPPDAALRHVENLQNDNQPTLTKAKYGGNGIALALGGGAARGWSHIGILRALDEAGIPISMIAGTSIGALVGGCYLAGKLDELEEFALSISRRSMLRYMDFAFRASGLISGRRLADRMDREIGELQIEDLDRRFIAIATDIETGNEIWLEHGSLSHAIRASYALPGVFEPVRYFGKQLVDGALVNPVPVSACRAFEEKLVLAVNLGGEVYGRSSVVRSMSLEVNQRASIQQQGDAKTPSWLPFGWNGSRDNHPDATSRLGFSGVMIEAFNIIQDRISRSRLAGDPPDFTIRPKLTDIRLSDFHTAKQAISIGYDAAKIMISRFEENGVLEALEC